MLFFAIISSNNKRDGIHVRTRLIIKSNIKLEYLIPQQYRVVEREILLQFKLFARMRLFHILDPQNYVMIVLSSRL